MIQDVGVGMSKDSSLMGTFTVPPPKYTPQTALVFTITSEVHFPLTIFTKSNTTMGSTSSDGTTVVDIQVQTCKGNEIQLETLHETKSSTPLSTIEISTLAIQNTSVDSDQNPSPLEEYDLNTSPVWAINTPNRNDILDQTFSFDEAIMEVMNISE